MILKTKAEPAPDASRCGVMLSGDARPAWMALPVIWPALLAPTELLAQEGVTPSPNVSENVGEPEMAWVWGLVALVAIIIVAVALVRRRR